MKYTKKIQHLNDRVRAWDNLKNKQGFKKPGSQQANQKL